MGGLPALKWTSEVLGYFFINEMSNSLKSIFSLTPNHEGFDRFPADSSRQS
jgi:hypothetical protein